METHLQHGPRGPSGPNDTHQCARRIGDIGNAAKVKVSWQWRHGLQKSGRDGLHHQKNARLQVFWSRLADSMPALIYARFAD